MDRAILHADLNSFFASVAQQDNVSLRGKPVGILKARGRTCVIACSNEAKTFGVKTGMPLSVVITLCPQIALVPADFNRYEAMTKAFIKICHNYSDVVEVFSLDEVFLDVTWIKHLFGGSVALALSLQEQIKKDMGEWIGCSIGIAKNKMLAKLASGMAPKKSILKVTDDNLPALLATAPFTEVCGIGYRLTARLNKMGIGSLPQISAAPLNVLLAEFGPFWALQLKRLAAGEDDAPLIPAINLPHAKSVSRTFTLFADTNDKKAVRALISNLVEEAAWKLRRMGLSGRQFGLAIRGGGQAQSGYITGKTFTNSGRFVFSRLLTLYDSWRWRQVVRYAGVWISLLEQDEHLTLPLFADEKRQGQINQAMDLVNQHYGYHTLHPATMMNAAIIRPEINGYLGDKQFRLNHSI